MFDLRHWRPRHLMASWCVYWVALIGVTMGNALVAISRAAGAGNGQGNVSVNLSNTDWSLTATLAGKTLWTGTASLLTIAVALAGPPLAIWVLWLRARGRETPREQALLGDAADVPVSEQRERAKASQRAR